MISYSLYISLQFYEALIIVRILLSWVGHDLHHPVIDFINDVTEPLLAQCRKLMPPSGMGMDFSPIIATLIVELVARFTQLIPF